MTTSQSRLFIAIFPPKKVLNQTRDIIRKLKKHSRNFNFVENDKLHFTVQFLGDLISQENSLLIHNTLQQMSPNLSSFEITLSNIAFGFPGQRSPKILNWMIESSSQLSHFSTQVHKAIKTLQLDDTVRHKDASKSIKHLTIARARRGISKNYARVLNNVLDSFEISPISFKSNEYSLVESFTTKKGIRYNKIGTYKLR